MPRFPDAERIALAGNATAQLAKLLDALLVIDTLSAPILRAIARHGRTLAHVALFALQDEAVPIADLRKRV